MTEPTTPTCRPECEAAVVNLTNRLRCESEQSSRADALALIVADLREHAARNGTRSVAWEYVRERTRGGEVAAAVDAACAKIRAGWDVDVRAQASAALLSARSERDAALAERDEARAALARVAAFVHFPRVAMTASGTQLVYVDHAELRETLAGLTLDRPVPGPSAHLSRPNSTSGHMEDGVEGVS